MSNAANTNTAFQGANGSNGAGYGGTSVSSQTIGSSGTKTFTTQSGLAYVAGSRVRAADASAPSTNWMEGVVSSYSGVTLIFTADLAAGSGTKTSWNLSLTGQRGATGAAGSTGAAGADGADGTDGTGVLSGTVPPDGSVGVDGDFYFNTTALLVYGPKSSGSWPAGVSYVGTAPTPPAAAVLTPSAGDATFDPATSDLFTMSMSSATQILASGAGNYDGQVVEVRIANSGGTHNLTFPVGFPLADGITSPTALGTSGYYKVYLEYQTERSNWVVTALVHYA